MLDSRHNSSHKKTYPIKSTKTIQSRPTQHGSNSQISFLDIPLETLVGVTSYLDPQSLLALAQVHHILEALINDDNTWRRAFANQFLNIGPEEDLQHPTKGLLLRRSELSWKSEFMVRHDLIQRWARSKASIISHIPLRGHISDMHLMPGAGLLSSSPLYGLVSPSTPIPGRISRKPITPSLDFGVGLGHHIAGFPPIVTTCAMSSDGGTAKVVWGFLNGEIGVTTVSQAMEGVSAVSNLPNGERRTTRHVRCDLSSAHQGVALSSAFDSERSSYVVSGGADGLTKLWDAVNGQCIWTSPDKGPNAECVKVGLSGARGWVAGVMNGGDIFIWTGFKLEQQPHPTAANDITSSVSEYKISCPSLDLEDVLHEVASFYLDTSSDVPTVLVSYVDDPTFYRFSVNADGQVTNPTAFGDASFGPISCLTPHFTRNDGSRSFVIVGDHIGCVSFYDWQSNPPINGRPLPPVKRFEAYQDGSTITSLSWNGVTLITGSARGLIYVWDALSFEFLRSFGDFGVEAARASTRRHAHTHPTDPLGRDSRLSHGVTNILVYPERDMMVASIGDSVLAWAAGAVIPKKSSNKGKAAKKKNRLPMGKYQAQVELHETILESKAIITEERKVAQRAHKRERDHSSTLDRLGLDEAGALEYALMLSREEEHDRMRGTSTAVSSFVDDTSGVLYNDSDTSEMTRASTRTLSSTPISHNVPTLEADFPLAPFGITTTTTAISSDAQQQQQASSSRSSKLNLQSHAGAGWKSRAITVPSTPSPKRVASSLSSSSASSQGSGSSDSIKSSRSAFASASAWNKPLGKSLSGSPEGGRAAQGQGQARVPGWGGRSGVVSSRHNQRHHRGGGGSGGDGDIDDDLRLAIQLSLEEARRTRS